MTKPLIYLAEPSRILAKIISSELEKQGYEVEIFQDGYSILKKLTSNSPKLIISDNNLAEIDGIELCKILKTGSSKDSIPFILISTDDSVFDFWISSIEANRVVLVENDNVDYLMEAVKSCIASAHRIVSGDDTEKTSYDPVYCAIDYIHRNIEKNITREDVSAYIHMNTDYFSRIFKNQVGRTVKDYIIDVKMDAAKKLLSSTDLPVNIIAVKTGFSSLSWFSQVFRKQIGLTPMEFRNNSKSDL